MNRLKNKTALITGATSGIGKACALALDALGVKLILTGRSQEKLAALCNELKTPAEPIELDVRDRAGVEAKLADLNVDILINNAGLALGLEPIDQGSADQWEEMIDANLKGLLFVSRAVIPGMRARNQGHIVNLGSIAGRMEYPGGNVYCATKHAVHSLSHSMNIDLAGTAIRVSNIAPGAVETEFSNTRFSGDLDRAKTVYAGYEPLRAEDIADLIVYVLNAPPHVNIQDTLIMPTAQRNPYVLHRES
ncbi:MAG: SDR family NAD(P)-dependent oxidoreductase [Campylobacterales bacterium]